MQVPQSLGDPSNSNARQEGTVNTINVARGFGFLKISNGTELFFHSNQLRNCEDIRLLREGDLVEFTEGPDAKNPNKKEAKEVSVKVDVSTRTKLQKVDNRSRNRSRSPYMRHDRRGGHYERGGYERGYDRPNDYYRPAQDPYYDPPHHDPYSRGGRSPYDSYSRSGRGYDDPYYSRGSHDYCRGGRDRGYGDHHSHDRGRDRPRGRSRSPPREEGTVKTLTERGYGFVDLQGNDYFFPAKEVVNGKFDELSEGDKVSCLIQRDPRDPDKWQAQQVRKVQEQGRIESMKTNFGYITNDHGEKIFFHGRHLQSCTFASLEVGMRVDYSTVPSHSHKGTFEAQEVVVLEEGDNQEQRDPTKTEP